MAIVVIGLLAGVWVVVLWGSARRPPDPVASVDHQRRALEAMATAADSARGRPRGRARAGPAPLGPIGRGSRWPGPRRTPIVGLAVVTALTLGLGALLLPRVTVGSDRVGSSRRPTSDPTTAATGTARGAGAHPMTTTTSTTLPPLAAITVGDGSTSRQVEVGRVGFVVSITATGPCWLQVRDAAGGTVAYEGTLAAAATRSFPAGTGAWIRLGAPGAVHVTVDGRPIEPAPGGDTPVDVVFESGHRGAA